MAPWIMTQRWNDLLFLHYLQDATFELAKNSMAQPAGIAIPVKPEIAHFAREMKVLFWAPERLL
jgi:uncharacterized protein YqjF (DUF2071 family)